MISGHGGWVRCVDIEPGNEWFVTGSADRIIKVLLTVLIISQNYHVWTRFSCGIQYLYEYALEHIIIMAQ